MFWSKCVGSGSFHASLNMQVCFQYCKDFFNPWNKDRILQRKKERNLGAILHASLMK